MDKLRYILRKVFFFNSFSIVKETFTSGLTIIANDISYFQFHFFVVFFFILLMILTSFEILKDFLWCVLEVDQINQKYTYCL